MKHQRNLALTLAIVGASLASPAHASLELIKKGRCVSCHAVDAKRVGPAYRDVSEKYKGQGDAAAHLFEKVRHGGAGTWGQIPMPPNGDDKLSDGELKSVIQWILDGAK